MEQQYKAGDFVEVRLRDEPNEVWVPVHIDEIQYEYGYIRYLHTSAPGQRIVYLRCTRDNGAPIEPCIRPNEGLKKLNELMALSQEWGLYPELEEDK
jgi:hypothetical protein